MRGYRLRNVTLILIVVNIIMFILQMVTGGPNAAFTYALLIKRFGAFTEPWTLLTSMFLHGSPWHLIVNMWMLFIFGPMIEQKMGSYRFLIMYLVSGILASFASNLIYGSALGASGAIMGVIGVAIILVPNLRIIMFPIPIPMSLRTFGIILVITDATGLIPGVAHLAHLAGLGTGFLTGLFLKRENRRFHQKFSRKTHMNDSDIDEYLRSGRI